MRATRGNESDEGLLESDGETIYEINAIYDINAIYRLYFCVYRVYLVARQYIDVTRPNIDAPVDIIYRVISTYKSVPRGSSVSSTIKASPAPPVLLVVKLYESVPPVAPRQLCGSSAALAASSSL